MGGVAIFHCFFYLAAYHSSKGYTEGIMPPISIGNEWVDNIAVSIGLDRLLAAIDAGQRFDRNTVIGAVLGWATEEGFAQTFSRYGLDQFNSAHAYRNRHILELTRGIKGLVGGS